MKKIICSSLLVIFFIAPSVLAFDPAKTGLTDTAETAGFDTSKTDLAVIIGTIIQVLLGLIGTVFLIITIYGGAMYMFPGGKEDNTKKGRAMIINGAIGMLIIALAYALSTFVINLLKG
jgi:cbb3-type cytochrome oxidase subunit 3